MKKIGGFFFFGGGGLYKSVSSLEHPERDFRHMLLNLEAWLGKEHTKFSFIMMVWLVFLKNTHLKAPNCSRTYMCNLNKILPCKIKTFCILVSGIHLVYA